MTSERDYDSDYQRHLERCATTSPPTRPLPRPEFDILSRRLDDLSILKLERQLTSREHFTLINLSIRLGEDVLSSILDVGDSLADERLSDGGLRDQMRRRAAWRHRRRRR